MPHEVETMAYVESRGIPWHKGETGDASRPLEALATSTEMLVASGQDWRVDQKPIYIQVGRKRTKVDGWVANVRDRDGKALGIVRPSYHVWQNADAFTWGDNLVDSGDAKWDTAGSLRGGEVVFMSMVLPEGVNVPGDEKAGEYRPLIVITNGHNGYWKAGAYVVLIRPVCMNTLNWGIKGAQSSFTLKHTVNFEGRLQQAREALGVTFNYIAKFGEQADRLMDMTVTDEQVEKVLADLFPYPEGLDAKAPAKFELTSYARALDTYRTSPNLDPIRGTGWSVVNAVAEYLDHIADYRGGRRIDAESARGEAILVGRARDLKGEAVRLVEGLAK